MLCIIKSIHFLHNNLHYHFPVLMKCSKWCHFLYWKNWSLSKHLFSYYRLSFAFFVLLHSAADQISLSKQCAFSLGLIISKQIEKKQNIGKRKKEKTTTITTDEINWMKEEKCIRLLVYSRPHVQRGERKRVRRLALGRLSVRLYVLHNGQHW